MGQKCNIWNQSVVESVYLPYIIYLYNFNGRYESSGDKLYGGKLIGKFYNGEEFLEKYYIAQNPNSPDGNEKIYNW